MVNTSPRSRAFAVPAATYAIGTGPVLDGGLIKRAYCADLLRT
jgi:hypothetical protein